MNIFKFLSNFYSFKVVDDDLTAEASNDVPTDDGGAVPVEAEVKETAEEFVEKALQDDAFNQSLEDAKPEEATKVDEPLSETAKQDTPKPDEAAKKTITDKDLEAPNTGNKSTNERIQSLIDGYKEKDTAFNEVNQKFEAAQAEMQQYQSSFDAIQQLGFNDAESAQSLIEFSQYRNAIKSGDVNTFTAMLAQEIQNFEIASGQKVNLNVSGIDKYGDLRQRVDNQELSEQDALRLARLNALEERANVNQQLQYQNNSNEQQQEKEINHASQEITRFKEYLQKNDPDFQKVVQVMQPHLDSIIGNLHPSQWLNAIETNYKLTKDVLTKAQPTRQVISPLRANNASSGKPVFKNVDEFVSHELDDENW